MMTLRKLSAPLAGSLFGLVAVSIFGAEPAVVVYPSGATVPENLLRIEVRSATPLRPELGIEHLRLLKEDGAEVENAFLDLVLPSADETRVAILLHPGRVKSGVGANLALGRALRAGETVTLVIAHPAVANAVRKTWRVTAFDAEGPNPKAWTFQPPQVGGREALVVRLDAPISAAAEGMIAVRSREGDWVVGSAGLEEGETAWRFVPDQAWRAGGYAVVTHPDLEDAAGNRPGARFEAQRASEVRLASGQTLPFEVTR